MEGWWRRGCREGKQKMWEQKWGGDWLILPLAAFSRHSIHLHTPSQPAFFSVRWFDVSFFLINSTFASIIQQKHPSEGMGMGECRGKGWGGFSGGVWETTSLQHIPSCCHPWEFVSCQHLKPIDNMLSEMRGAPRWQNKIYIRKNLLSEMTLILINVWTEWEDSLGGVVIQNMGEQSKGTFPWDYPWNNY